MVNFLTKMKEKVSSLTKSGLSISITEEMLLYGVQEYMKGREITISELDVIEDAMSLSGYIKKFGLPVRFSITLAQEGFNEREVRLKVLDIKPLNNKWLNSILFNKRSQYLSYKENIIQVDIDALEKLKNIRLGKIINFKLLQGKVVIQLSG